MEMIVGKLVPDPRDPRSVMLKIPTALLPQAHMEVWGEVTMRAEGGVLVLEALAEDTEALELYAEEGIQRYVDVLRSLSD